jgi:hypothetical protein
MAEFWFEFDLRFGLYPHSTGICYIIDTSLIILVNDPMLAIAGQENADINIPINDLIK